MPRLGRGWSATSNNRKCRKIRLSHCPRHDENGHTWQHPDQVLFEVVKYGVQAPTNLYPMSPYAENLTDKEIFGIIEYFKQWWTDDQRQHQSTLTTKFEENNPFWSTDDLDDES